MPKQPKTKEGVKKSITIRKQIREDFIRRLETEGVIPIHEAVLIQRKILGLTQQQLAERANVGVTQIRAIEKGEGNPTLQTINQILESLGQLRLYAASKPKAQAL